MSIANLIDHTLLKVDATQADILKLCQEAKEFHTYSVCVNPAWVATAKDELQNSPIAVCSVIGFPLGATFDAVVRVEAEFAILQGADELDMVMNVGAFKSKKYRETLQGIRHIVDLAHGNNRQIPVKVIVESVVLSEAEKREAAALVVESGADFLKTSTGTIPNPNLLADVKLFMDVLPANFPVKAAGGIRTYDTAKALIDMGVQRIGASSTRNILAEEQKQSN